MSIPSATARSIPSKTTLAGSAFSGPVTTGTSTRRPHSAADTFRAGAVAQLAEWGRRVDVPVVTGPEKADPASVLSC